jgi:hypothetical protein
MTTKPIIKKTYVISISCAIGLAACATSPAVRSVRSDLRVSTAVSTPAPRLLVTGPVRLLHANYDRRAGVTFFKAALSDGAATIDCATSAPLGWDGTSNLDVREGEGICVAAVREASLSWHARTGVEPPQPTQHAKR